MTIEIPSTGERVEARILPDEPSTPLVVTLGPAGCARYTLALMLREGWRIVGATRAELAMLAVHGIMPVSAS